MSLSNGTEDRIRLLKSHCQVFFKAESKVFFYDVFIFVCTELLLFLYSSTATLCSEREFSLF